MATKTYSNQQIGALSDAFKRDPVTIKRWIKDGNDKLSSKKALMALTKLNNKKDSYFIKGNVYSINGGKKMLCILVDKELACLSFITPHKKDSGYSTNYRNNHIYAAAIADNGDGFSVEIVAQIMGLHYMPAK